MTETTEIAPSEYSLRLSAEAAEIIADPTPGADGKQRFKITGYSGGMIHKRPRWGDVVIDLDGIKVAKQRGPVLLDHEPGNRVGFSESVKLSHEEGVVVNGVFLKSTPASKQVLEESREGYPWQASVHVELAAAPQRMAAGETAHINGRDFTFPDGGHVFRKTRLREVSFVTLGADELTSAEALSFVSAPTEKSMEPEKKEGQSAPPPPLTRDRLKAEHPEVYSAAFADGVAAERSRVSELFDAAPDAAREVFAPMLKEGVSVNEGLKRLLADTRRIKTEKLAAITAASDKPVGGGTEAEKKTYATPEERFKAEFAAMSHALKAEYGNEESYVGFQQAKAKNAYKMYVANTAPTGNGDNAPSGEAL